MLWECYGHGYHLRFCLDSMKMGETFPLVGSQLFMIFSQRKAGVCNSVKMFVFKLLLRLCNNRGHPASHLIQSLPLSAP